jgi:diguanylate cyclase (GGDEF)-like protein
MQILVLSNDPTDQKVIEQVIERAGHQSLTVGDSQAAWDMLEKGDTRYIVVDRSNTDVEDKQFIARVRAAKFTHPVYILMVLAKSLEQNHTGADDYIHKPLAPAELKSRIAIGERILGLGDNLSQARDQLENLALQDELTNLLNDKAFLATARGELERARRAQSSFCLIALNILDFDSLIETQGRETSDNILRLIAQLIREKSRPYDCIGHWEADQYFIALPGLIGADAERFVERIINGNRSMTITTLDDVPVRVELNAGIVAAARISAVMDIPEMIQQAIQSLQRAGDGGGNRIALTYL